MSSEQELDEGIKSIKSAWRREHTARTNLKRMLEQAEAENAKLRELLVWAVEVAEDYYCCSGVKDDLDAVKNEMRELGIKVNDE